MMCERGAERRRRVYGCRGVGRRSRSLVRRCEEDVEEEEEEVRLGGVRWRRKGWRDGRFILGCEVKVEGGVWKEEGRKER